MESMWHHLGWNRPLGLEFADRLKEEAGESRVFDHCLIWVPSSRAGRHILNQLFDKPGEDMEAFHPPRLITPAQFVRSLLQGDPAVATEAQCLFAWKQVLDRVDPAAIKAVFPVIPRERKSAWAYTIAQQLMRLRERLMEDQWNFQKVAAEELPNDRERWTALGHLEKAYLDQLSAGELRDPDNFIEELLSTGLPPQPYTRLMIVGVLNLSMRQAACVNSLKKAGLSVDSYLAIPGECASDFDPLGRPCKGVWDIEALPDELIAGRIQRAPEPRELVDRILDLAEAYGSEVDSLVVGSPERELADYLIERSQLTKAPFYAPEGRPLTATGWGRLIELVSDWQRRGQLGTLFEMLNHSLFRGWAEANGIAVETIQVAIQAILKEQLLKCTDQLVDNGLGPSGAIGTVREFIGYLDTCGFGGDKGAAFPQWLWNILRQVAGARQLESESLTVIRQIEELLQNMQAEFDPANMKQSDYWELLNFQLSSTQFYPDRAEEDRPVSGWLELPWESAPHIVLLSLPDSQVPGPKIIDSFLTPALCRLLGLYGPDELAAFHAFRLRLLLESRRDWGRVDILLPDRGLDDSPLLPSRFLFLTGESEIIGRVNLLLDERPAEERPLPAEFGVRLTPPSPPELTRISVTALRAYLTNPFQFYLQNLNRWSPPEALPREMDALHFGHFAHEVLESLNSTEAGIGLRKEKEISEFLIESLYAAAVARFGSRQPVAVQIQIGSLAERLRAAGQVIASERAAGWLPEKVEWAFHEDLDFQISGVPLRGVIDLIEKNSNSGLYRIIDYKTSDKATHPAKAHLTYPNARSQDPLFPECEFVDGEKTARWKDLQLPLYQKAVELLTGENAVCAYFNLSKAVGEIGLEEWCPSPEQQTAAIQCAEAIIQRIRNSQFTVGGRSYFEDPWLKWFGGDYEKTLDTKWLKAAGGSGS